MSTVRELYRALGAKIAEGDGDLPVFAVHGASGDVNEAGSFHHRTQEDVSECGPFDVDGDWVELYIGN